MTPALENITRTRFKREIFVNKDLASEFARLSLDDNDIHHSHDYAANTRVGRPVLSGTQTGGYMMGLAASSSSALGEAVGIEFQFKFLAPVYVDQKIEIEWLVYRSVYKPKIRAYILYLIGRVRDSKLQTCVGAKGRTLVYESR